jgi:membrane protease YdiL (CAAX protease family)
MTGPVTYAFEGLVFLVIAAYALAISRHVRGAGILPSRDMPPARWGIGVAVGVFVLFWAARIAAVVAMKAAGPLAASMPVMLVMVYGFSLPSLAVVFKAAPDLAETGLSGSGRLARIGRGAWLFLLVEPMHIGYIALVWMVTRLMGGEGFVVQKVAVELGNASGLSFLVIASAAVVVGPVYEEIVFRGCIQRGLQRTLGREAGIIVTAMLFALAHGSRAGAYLFLVSLAMGVIYDRGRDLFVNIGFHAALNLTSVLFVVAQGSVS